MPDDTDTLDAETDVTTSDAESSTAQDVKDKDKAAPSADKDDKKTLADVVKDVVDKHKSESSTDEGEESDEEGDAQTESDADKSDEKDEQKEKKDDKKEDKKDDVPLDEKDKALPFHNHPRFREVIKERATFKQEAETLRPAAQRAQAIDQYCQKHGISDEEFNSAIQLTALLHTDPAKALDALRSYVDTLEVSLGNKLPTDLQKEVDDGTLSLERAKELTNARIKNQGLEHTTKKSEAQIAQERSNAITTAVNSWDAQKRASDTAYDKKYPLIEKSFIALCTMTPPKTPQEAIALAEKAYTEVNTALGSFIPKPPARKVLKTNGSVTKGVIDIKPGMNLKEALPLIVRKVLAEHTR